MAADATTQNAIFADIQRQIKEMNGAVASHDQPAAIRDLAEAYAWAAFPNQPHGGQSVVTG